MRKKIGFTLMIIGAVMLIAALSLLTYNRMENKNAGEAVQSILPSVLAASEQPTNPSQSDNPYDTENEEMLVTEIDGYGYIGSLFIPALDLELPVMSQWDYKRLRIAPCRYFGSTKTNDLVICAHNFVEHFGMLKKLKPGDIVLFTCMDGEMIVYEVKEVAVLYPTQISEMIESDYDLTLFTCTYSNQARVTVRCQVIEK